VPRITILYASTSGHTEYVVEHLAALLRRKAKSLDCSIVRVEKATVQDLACDLLVLASGTWNTGGVEGQLNPHMHDFVRGTAKDADLHGTSVAIIALGDDRYFYTSRAGEHLRQFALSHGGTVWPLTLTIINDPYGQEKKVEQWGEKLLQHFLSLTS
jgi:flavodoxin I